MIGDYETEVAQRRYDHATGSGTADVTVPLDAWVTGFTFSASGGDATLVITPGGAAALSPITVRDGDSFDAQLLDRGQLAGATFAFTDAEDFVVTFARSTPWAT